MFKGQIKNEQSKAIHIYMDFNLQSHLLFKKTRENKIEKFNHIYIEFISSLLFTLSHMRLSFETQFKIEFFHHRLPVVKKSL